MNVTIPKHEYDYLVTQAKRIKFLDKYKPSISNYGDQGTYEMVVHNSGIIETIRYGSLIDCIDNAIKDIQKMQQVFWVDEDTEIYAGHTIEEIIHEFFDEQDRERILKEKMYGKIDLNQKFIVRDENSDIGMEKTAKELIDETVTFPDLILTVY